MNGKEDQKALRTAKLLEWCSTVKAQELLVSRMFILLAVPISVLIGDSNVLLPGAVKLGSQKELYTKVQNTLRTG